MNTAQGHIISGVLLSPVEISPEQARRIKRAGNRRNLFRRFLKRRRS